MEEVKTSASTSKAGPSTQPDPITHLNPRTSNRSDAQAMETDFSAGPSLPPRFTRSVQSDHGSKHLDLQSEHSDPQSEHSEQPKRVCSSRPKKHSDKKKHKVRAKYYFQSSSSEEDQSSVPVKKSAKSQQAPSEQDQQQDNPDPVFYREIDISNLPSQYAEEVETFRHILDLPDPRETMARSSTTVLDLDDEKGQQELRPRGPSAMLPLNLCLKDALKNLNRISRPLIYLRVNILYPCFNKKYYKVGQPCFEDKLQELNTDFAKICISPKPSGAPIGKVPLQV